MTLSRILFGVLSTVAWLGALVATFGAAILNADLMGISGVVAAVAALVWGIGKAVTRGAPDVDYRSCSTSDHPFGDLAHTCIVADGDDLRYTSVDRGRMVP